MTDKEILREIHYRYGLDDIMRVPHPIIEETLQNDITWLIEQVEELTKERNQLKGKLGVKKKVIKDQKSKLSGAYNHVNRVQNDNQAKKKVLEKRNKQLEQIRETVEFYANERNYRRSEAEYFEGYPPEIMNDTGYKARQALEVLE